MGNHTSSPDKKKRSFIKLPKLKWKKPRHKKARSLDHFIVERSRNRKSITSCSSSLPSELDVRRVVFVSLMGLRLTWMNVPYHTLYAALCILPLKRKWIYHPRQYAQELSARLLTKFALNSEESKEFILFLKWKDSQGLVCWMLDALDSDSSDGASLVASVWYILSAKLLSLYDPVTGQNYKPLHLEPSWWQNKDTFVSKYDTKAASILSELYFVTMKFNALQEIIYQSNPASLIPIKSYAASAVMNRLMPDTPAPTLTPSSENSSWFISEDYDPYDIE